METIRELYKVGRGPSSSHTMGPEKACLYVKRKYDGDFYKVILFGSLSLTGKGHLTDKIILETLKNVEIVFDNKTTTNHPNTMDIEIYKDDELIKTERFYSVGGGSITQELSKKNKSKCIYPHNSFEEVRDYCIKKDILLSDYVFEFEDSNFRHYLHGIWNVMKDSIQRGLQKEGTLPGVLEVKKKARELFHKIKLNELKHVTGLSSATAYAYAVSEENASGGLIVTAPTCGASGVLPGVLQYLQDKHRYTDDEIVNGLATAGLIGNIVKHNASISGAEAGCQAEIGTACSMAAAACSELYKQNIDSIEYAAEMALEHHLGLTCDPVLGYVQIPCIERNAVGALRALNASELAAHLYGTRLISFDAVVETMMETGKDLKVQYRETSEGGLAKYYKKVIGK